MYRPHVAFIELAIVIFMATILSITLFSYVKNVDMVPFFQAAVIITTLFVSLGGLIYVELNKKFAELADRSENSWYEILKFTAEHSDKNLYEKVLADTTKPTIDYFDTMLKARRLTEVLLKMMLILSSVCIFSALYSMLLPTNFVSFWVVNMTLPGAAVYFLEIILVSGKPFDIEIRARKEPMNQPPHEATPPAG